MNKTLMNILAFNIIFSSIMTITAMNPVISVIYLIGTFFNAAGYLILTGITFVGLSYLIIYVGAIAVLFLFVIMMINIKLTDILETGNQFTKNIPLALAIGVLFIFIIFSVIPFNLSNQSPVNMLLYFLNNSNTSILLTDSVGIETKIQYTAGMDASSLSLVLNQITQVNQFPQIITSLHSLRDSTPETIITEFGQMEVLGLGLYTYGGILLIILSVILLLAMVSSILLTEGHKALNKVPKNKNE